MDKVNIWQEPLVLLNKCLDTLEQSREEFIINSFTYKKHSTQIRKYKKAIKQLTQKI
jgi:hypothetical protein